MSNAPPNAFWVMRHGQSRPNVAGVIICNPAAGIDPANGLTALGRQQARDGATRWATNLNRPPVIVSSDFSRARETAEEVRAVTEAGPIRIDARLRERDFGPLDGGPVSGYHEVWQADAEGRTLAGVESVADVLARTTALIHALDGEYRGQQILLVCHGDTAQITLAAGQGLPPARHRDLPSLGNAEIHPLGMAHLTRADPG